MRKRKARKNVPRVKLNVKQVVAFKIANRRGYATIVRNILTEGRSIPQAYSRLMKAARSRGFELPVDRQPKAR